MAEGRYIAYYRVSTQQQGRSGLGLAAQRKAVTDYLNGGRWDLIGEFTEIETGKGANALDKRPQLRAAIAMCKKRKATLVVAKLDRLARNVHFISGLSEAKIDFVAADNPKVNEFTVNILAAVAQEESKQISQRTKDALAAAKARGVKLGQASHANRKASRSKLAALNERQSAAADAHAEPLRNVLRALRDEGKTLRQITEKLNASPHKAPRGGAWHLATVQRVLARIGQ